MEKNNILKSGTRVTVRMNNKHGTIQEHCEWHGADAYVVRIDGWPDCIILSPEGFDVD